MILIIWRINLENKAIIFVYVPGPDLNKLISIAVVRRSLPILVFDLLESIPYDRHIVIGEHILGRLLVEGVHIHVGAACIIIEPDGFGKY